MDYIVRSGGLSGFLELVESLGRDPLALLEEAGVSPAALKDPDTYLPYLALPRLLNLAAQRCECDDFGARLGLHQGLEITGAMGAQVCLQETMGDAMTMIHRHLDFHARGCLITPEVIAGKTVLTMEFAFADQIDCSHLMAMSMGVLKRSLSQLQGGMLSPLRVEMQQEAPSTTSNYSRLFSAPVKFGQAFNRIYYPSDLKNLPVQPEPGVRRALLALWRRSGSEKLPLSLSQQVERAITSLLPTGDCDLNTIASMVELHPRVLQKLLKRDQQSFSSILKTTREKLAREHLAHSKISLTELSLYLGFGDLAVFSRSFKKWTGLPPSEWRQKYNSAQEPTMAPRDYAAHPVYR